MPNPTAAASAAIPVEIKRGRKTYDGAYTVADGTITVAYLDATKKAKLGASAPEVVARKLLAELVAAAETRNKKRGTPRARNLKAPRRVV
jgi:hypothetical protein